MECCYPDDCGEYSVTPVLMAPCYPTKCYEEAPICYPCLPRCHKPAMVYGEKKSKPRPRCDDDDDCCDGCDIRKPCPSPPRHKRAPTSQSATNCQPPPNCCPTCWQPTCKPVRTKYVIPCYRYEDGRIVQKLPVTAFKRNGMQDQEHSKLLGTANFLTRCPRDVSIECDICTNPIKVGDPAKVPLASTKPALNCCLLKKKPIEVTIEDILDE